MKKWIEAAFALTLLASLAATAGAAPFASPGPSSTAANPTTNTTVSVDASMIVPVSGGCGPNGWRGPWGHCRNTPYHGRLPDGSWK